MKPFILLATVLLLLACSSKKTENTSAAELYVYDVEKRLTELGIELTFPEPPVANYVNAVRTGNLVFLSGKIPQNPDKTVITGKIDTELTIEQGYQAARIIGIAQLSALKAEIGDLNKVVRIVKVTGMVNATPEFSQHPKVINGFSDLMVEVFGERGKHARAAVGMSSLPLNAACEIEMIVQIQD
jgi:enamine deaminase RidA (YjgF/YER057c/UK114 family)